MSSPCSLSLSPSSRSWLPTTSPATPTTPPAAGNSPGLERQRLLLARVVEVADVDATAQADAGADRRQDDVVALLIVHAEAADHVDGTLDAGEALEDLAGFADVVDEGEDFRGVGAEIEADRRTLPVDAHVLGDLAMHPAVAVAHADGDGPGRFLAADVGVGLALVLEDLLDDGGEVLRGIAEESLGGRQDLVLRVLVGRVLLGQGRNRNGERQRQQPRGGREPAAW